MSSEHLAHSQFIDDDIHPREFPPNVIDKLTQHRDHYKPLTVPIVQRTTNREGLARLLQDRTWHGSHPLNLPAGSLLAVVNDELPATPGSNIYYFAVTQSEQHLDSAAAQAEWAQHPFRTAGFAKKYGYFPYVLPGLVPLSREQVLAQYFRPPSSTIMSSWMDQARAISGRANCYKRKFGAVITENGRIVAAGNNYTHSGYDQAECDPCLRLNVVSGTRVESCRAIHAEQQTVINAFNFHLDLWLAILTVAGQEPDGSPFMNPQFYCTVCSRILREVNGLIGVVTDAKEGPQFHFMEQIINESYSHI
jgi:deoxycytidylate deaminase